MKEHPGVEGAIAGSPETIVVLPCFNEAGRLDTEAFGSFVSENPGTGLLFVDDGSTDGTRALLEGLHREHPASVGLLVLDHNRGKGEAVRLGILEAAAFGPEYVGFWDADLAAPLSELPRLRAVFDERPGTKVVLGSRVNLLGRHVHRKLTRHYVGRVFATAVALALRLPVYDTQCGAKLFRCSDDVLDLFREPFFSGWIFDVELLARLVDQQGDGGASAVAKLAFELPLLHWREVQGSSLRLRDFVGALRDALRIYTRQAGTRRARPAAGGPSTRVLNLVRAILRRLSVERHRVPIVEKVARGALLVPVFGALLLWTRARGWLLGPLRVSATTREGSRFECDLPDFIQTYLFLFGIWEPDISAFISERLAPEDTFVDVGANIGYHSLLASKALGPRGHVVAIEASRALFERLEATLAANEATGNVRAINRAVTDVEGEVVVYGGPIKNVGLTTTVESRGFAPESCVSGSPLGDLLEPDELRTARIVKIDVEGGEDAVLRGMQSIVDSCRGDLEILVELSPQWWRDRRHTPEDVLRPFSRAGFHVYEIENNLWPWRYLWPAAVRRPRRFRGPLSTRRKRFDLVLSRVDAEKL